MAALERFLHHDHEHLPLSLLLKAAPAHVQFETIHPFLDGNGRLGRLLIALLLHEGGALVQPLLYLSLDFKQHRQRYYELLDGVRTRVLFVSTALRINPDRPDCPLAPDG